MHGRDSMQSTLTFSPLALLFPSVYGCLDLITMQCFLRWFLKVGCELSMHSECFGQGPFLEETKNIEFLREPGSLTHILTLIKPSSLFLPEGM